MQNRLPALENERLKTSIELLILFSFCAIATLVNIWHIDEGVITIMLDHFQKTGDLTYLFQHSDARFSFGWGHFYVLGLFQPHPLDPHTYYLLRFPAALMVFLSAWSVYFYVSRTTTLPRPAAFFGGLAMVVGAAWMSVITARYDANYLFGNATLVFVAAMRGDFNSKDCPRLYPVALAASLVACMFVLTSHPNGIACLAGWGVLWLFTYRSLDLRGHVIVAIGVVLSVILFWKGVLVGRTPSEFMADLNKVRDSVHNFDLVASMRAQYQWSLQLLRLGDFFYRTLVICIIVFTLELVWRWREIFKLPLHVILVWNVLFFSMQSAKHYFYYGLILPLALALLFSMAGRVYQKWGKGLSARINVARCAFAFLSVAGIIVLGQTWVADATKNSLLQVLVHPNGTAGRKVAELRKSLAGKPMALFTDLRVVPLFSFMDLSVFYHDVHGVGEKDDAPWGNLGEYAFCSTTMDSLSCALAKKNIHFAEHNFELFRRFTLFGEGWRIYHITKKVGKDQG